MEIMVEIVWIMLSLIFSFIINYAYARMNHKPYKFSSHLIIFAILVIYGFLAMQAGSAISGQVELVV